MALDPSIALGVRPIQVADPLAQYGQIAQLQNYQNQNALAQFQLGSAQRQEAAQNALSSAYQKAYNPDTGEVNNAMLVRGLAEGGAGHLIPEVQAKLLATQKEQGLIKKTGVETSGLEFKQRIDKANKAISDIAALNSPQEAVASIDRHLASGDIDQQKADMLKANLGSAPSFGAWQKGMLTNILDAKEKLTLTAPKPTEVNLNNRKIFLDLNPNSPTFQQEILPSQKVGMSPESSARLAFDQSKFAWERANPGFELKESEDGTMVGVNKRTLQAFPVTVGGAVPAPTSMISGPRVPAATGTPANAQVIPGMNSVLDRPATSPAASFTPQPPQAGMPLKGQRKEAPENFIKTDNQLANLAGSLKAFKDEVKASPTTGAKWLPTGQDTARMQAKYTSLLMGVKDLYTLGALTGPDLGLLETQITNPASWSGKFTTQKGFEEQVQVVEDMLKRGATNLENSYGRVPRATKKALEVLPSGGGVTGASETNPLGLPGR